MLQGCIYVKLKEEPAGEVRVRSIGNTVTTGVKVLDRAASSLKSREWNVLSLMLASLKNVPVKRGFIYGIMSGFLKRHRPPVLLPKWLSGWY